MRDREKDIFFEDEELVKKRKLKAKRKAALVVLALLIVVSAAAELFIKAGDKDALSVYIQIRCDAVVQSADKLENTELLQYIPSDGEALARLKYVGKNGDSVLDVLNKVCSGKNIDVKVGADGMPETIGYLSQGDCGENSGWIYTVNGKLYTEDPSGFIVQNGDEIVWAFTCDGGKDIEIV